MTKKAKCGDSRNISKSVPNLFSSTNFSWMKLFYYNITFFNNVISSKYFVSDITYSGPFFSFVVIWYRPFANNDIRDRRPAPSIREPRYHRPESLCHIFEAANLLAHCRKKEPLTALGFSIPHNNIVQHSSVSSKESLCKHTKAFFSNSLTKQLLLLFLLGLKHVDRPLKGNFEKQAEPTSSLLLKLNNSTTNLYFVVLYQW